MTDLLSKLKTLKIAGRLKEQKVLVILIVCPVLLYLDFAFIIKSQLNSIKTSLTRTTRLKTDIDNLNKDLAIIQRLKSSPSGVAQKITPESREIINDEGIPSLLQYISDAANKNNVRILQIKPFKDLKAKQAGPAAPQDKPDPLLITLDLSCDYHNFGKFINELENKKFFISAEEIKIRPDPGDSFKQAISAVLKTYVKK